MYFKNLIENIIKNNDNCECHLLVDMDGVITDYNVGHPVDFKNKRPILTNIKTFEEISKLDGVTLHILSICKKNKEIDDKNNWLDKYAPFFKKENRMIISKEIYPDLCSKELKEIFINQCNKEYGNDMIIVVDDDNEILKYLGDKHKNVILFQDSSIID